MCGGISLTNLRQTNILLVDLNCGELTRRRYDPEGASYSSPVCMRFSEVRSPIKHARWVFLGPKHPGLPINTRCLVQSASLRLHIAWSSQLLYTRSACFLDILWTVGKYVYKLWCCTILWSKRVKRLRLELSPSNGQVILNSNSISGADGPFLV